MRFPAEVIITLALGFAAAIFWRLHVARLGNQPSAPPPAAIGTPPGAPYLPLGQYAVIPSRQWLLISPGQ